jgi:hypothetical protein
MTQRKASPTRDFFVSSTSWLGRAIIECSPFDHVVCEHEGEQFVVIDAMEYLMYTTLVFTYHKQGLEDA